MNETNLQIVRLVISIVKELAKLVITVLGFYVVISTGPDRLFNDPLYTMVVLVFAFVLMSDARTEEVKNGGLRVSLLEMKDGKLTETAVGRLEEMDDGQAD